MSGPGRVIPATGPAQLDLAPRATEDRTERERVGHRQCVEPEYFHVLLSELLKRRIYLDRTRSLIQFLSSLDKTMNY